jgi:signal transduction histidine kinase
MAKTRSLSRQISWVTGIVSTTVIIFSSLTFSLAYYLLVQHDSRSLLVKEGNEVIRGYITYANGKLSLPPTTAGETLPVKLQNFNLSAIIYDANLLPVSTYGIYQSIPYASQNNLRLALTSNKLILTTHVVSDNLTYETLVEPIYFDNHTRGVLVLSRPYEFIAELLQLNLIVLAFSLPISLLLGWVLSVTTIKRAFTPLNKLVDYLRQIQFDSRITKLEFKDDPGVEIASLTTAFNDMVSRVGDSLDKQKNFVAHASHELKTPLTQAISSLDLAQTTSDPKYISQVKEDLMSLNQILDSLLVMSKITSSSAPAAPATEINIAPLISEILTQYASAINQKKLELTVNIPHAAKIQFPPEHFRILVSNLISNAIKFNIRGGQIHLTWSDSALTVTDTGIGMNPEEQTHMFDRFYRGRNKLTSTKGTGLGLALVKLIADQHHLTIVVTTSPHHGTSVLVRFP